MNPKELIESSDEAATIVLKSSNTKLDCVGVAINADVVRTLEAFMASCSTNDTTCSIF